MSNVKLGFGKMKVPDKIQVSRNIVTQMGIDITDFPTPNPSLIDMTTATDTLEAAYTDSRDGGKAKNAFMRLQEKALISLMSKLVAYVQVASGGDETIILRSGMLVKASKKPPQPMDTPQGVTVKTGKNEGEIIPKWSPVKKSVSYAIRKSIDGINWQDAGNCTKATTTISGFASGTKPWISVAAIGAKGQGPWSSPAQGMAA